MITNEFYAMQINMAAHGFVSGRLSEWPVLSTAFAYYGVTLNSNARKNEMQIAAIKISKNQGWM